MRRCESSHVQPNVTGSGVSAQGYRGLRGRKCVAGTFGQRDDNMCCMGLLGWALVMSMLLGLIFLASKGKLKDKYGQPLLRSRGSAIGAFIAGLGLLLVLVGSILDRDPAGAIRYAILLALLATLVVVVSQQRSDA